MYSTVQLFRHLYITLPPLFPEETKQRIKHALEHLENNEAVAMTEVEKTMVLFGYDVWPWTKAYHEFYAAAEHAVGEHFLLPKLSPDVQARYQEFKTFGGTFRDLHTGNGAAFFSVNERAVLGTALVDTAQELRAYVTRQVEGTERNRYLKRVYEFGTVLDDIKQTMERLNELADREQEHPTLSQEIRARVRAFEYGLCYLGPEPDYEAVTRAEEHFKGRKMELNRLKGIELPMEVDWFAEEGLS